MKVITLTIDETEAQNLVQLIEISIRAGGSQNGRVGIPLQDKIALAAANAAEAPKPTTKNAGGEPTQP
jgi:hypothetical protein